MMRPTIVLILLLLATYVLAPVLDVVACDDCKDDISLQTEREILSNDRYHSDSTTLTADPGKSVPSGRGTAKALCPLCSNAASETKSYTGSAPVLTIHAVSLPELLALRDPSYPINKPPQN